MKFQKFQFQILRDYIFIIPTIILRFDEARYIQNKCFGLELHFLCFHCRWFWRDWCE